MICIIPARGGSQRFPGKNIIDLYGKPIINRTIAICRKSGIFKAVVVSTDSEQIAEVVRGSADVYFRPELLSGDSCETEVLKDFMDIMGKTEICRVYPFACLLTPQRLYAGFSVYRTLELQRYTVMECVKYSHPTQRMLCKKTDGDLWYRWPYETLMNKTQDLEPTYHDAGTFMFTTREALDKPLGERNIKWLEVPEIEVQDVDTPEDFELLKLKFARREG